DIADAGSSIHPRDGYGVRDLMRGTEERPFLRKREVPIAARDADEAEDVLDDAPFLVEGLLDQKRVVQNGKAWRSRRTLCRGLNGPETGDDECGREEAPRGGRRHFAGAASIFETTTASPFFSPVSFTTPPAFCSSPAKSWLAICITAPVVTRTYFARALTHS